MSGVWVFGYGSLVSARSFGHTVGRELRYGVDLFEAEVTGFGRRWHYGVTRAKGVTDVDGERREWTIVALGIAAAAEETTNGVVAWVSHDELPALDAREQHYDRVEVTHGTIVRGAIDGPVVTYVPRPGPVRAYEDARDRGEAAIEQRYWDLVDRAFAALGADRRERYHASTPAPDVPILAMERTTVPTRHLVDDGARPPR